MKPSYPVFKQKNPKTDGELAHAKKKEIAQRMQRAKKVMQIAGYGEVPK